MGGSRSDADGQAPGGLGVPAVRKRAVGERSFRRGKSDLSKVIQCCQIALRMTSGRAL